MIWSVDNLKKLNVNILWNNIYWPTDIYTFLYLFNQQDQGTSDVLSIWILISLNL